MTDLPDELEAKIAFINKWPTQREVHVQMLASLDTSLRDATSALDMEAYQEINLQIIKTQHEITSGDKKFIELTIPGRKPYNGVERELAFIGRAMLAKEKEDREVRRELRKPMSRSERRDRARSAKIPTDRRCPICKELKLKRRQWVYPEGQLTAICITCHRLGCRDDGNIRSGAG